MSAATVVTSAISGPRAAVGGYSKTVLRPRAATRTDQETDTSTRTSLARPWNVICHDDPVTPMSYVVQVFMRVFGYQQPKAQRLMLEVHNTGRSVVWTGSRETAEVYVQKLHGRQLRATLEQNDD